MKPSQNESMGLSDERCIIAYIEWLTRKGYVMGTVEGWTRTARRILKAYPLGVPDDVDQIIADIIPKHCTRATRCAARTAANRFLEFMRGCGTVGGKSAGGDDETLSE